MDMNQVRVQSYKPPVKTGCKTKASRATNPKWIDRNWSPSLEIKIRELVTQANDSGANRVSRLTAVVPSAFTHFMLFEKLLMEAPNAFKQTSGAA
jgi:hypothetical protein